MNKKVLLSIVGLTFVLTACGAKATDATESTEAASVETTQDAGAEATEATEETAEEEDAATEETTEDVAATESTDVATEETSDSAAEEATDDGLSRTAADGIDFSTVDMSKYATFTEIIDSLNPEMAFANATISETDVLLVASGSYDNLDGNQAAIDSAVFMYDSDGNIAYLGDVECGGTAMPIAVVDGNLVVGGNHFITKYAIADGELVIAESAYEEYDASGNATYYYASEGSEYETVDSDSDLLRLYEEYESAEIVNFMPAS